jgi:hypothetical protein
VKRTRDESGLMVGMLPPPLVLGVWLSGIGQGLWMIGSKPWSQRLTKLWAVHLPVLFVRGCLFFESMSGLDCLELPVTIINFRKMPCCSVCAVFGQSLWSVGGSSPSSDRLQHQ